MNFVCLNLFFISSRPLSEWPFVCPHAHPKPFELHQTKQCNKNIYYHNHLNNGFSLIFMEVNGQTVRKDSKPCMKRCRMTREHHRRHLCHPHVLPDTGNGSLSLFFSLYLQLYLREKHNWFGVDDQLTQCTMHYLEQVSLDIICL